MAKLFGFLINLTTVGMLLCMFQSSAQLGFCNGNSGEAIFTETFGTGTTPGPPLAAGTTSYNFTSGTPLDGSYTISSTSDFFGWHTGIDHTPNDTNGKYFIINADFVAGEFYNRAVSGLCENTSYEFSSWLVNLLPPTTNCPNGGIPINVRFQIWDSSNTRLLASGDTGAIPGTNTPNWEQYALVFKTEPGQTSVILKMLNNSNGGCGNDLAIDDIVFKSCGDFIAIANNENQSSIALCEDEGPTSQTLTLAPDFAVFQSHFYQWQVSQDNINWNDIPGETSESYTTPILSSSTYYRAKVAEDPLNVSNSSCNVISDTFELLFVPIPDAPGSNGDTFFCANENGSLTVQVTPNTTANWYDAPTGGNLLLANSTVYIPTTSGTYYAEASSTLTSCFSTSRTALSATIFEIPMVLDENVNLCQGSTISLSAGITNVSYVWSTGETTETIEVTEPGIYTVTVTNAQSCSNIKTITVTQVDTPIIETIISDSESIVVSVSNPNDYEYSLDGSSYQNSAIFNFVEGGQYMIYVRGKNNCAPATQAFIHFVIPKFFTPNGDGFNDTLILQGLEFFNLVEIHIFDRFGKLLAQSNSNSFEWNGTLNGKILMASDYWYSITTDTTIFKGHFALVR